MSNLMLVQKLFKSASNHDFVLPAGRANTLLYAFFKTLPENTKVIFPAIMCPSPLFVAELAGLVPVLCDVDLETGLINLDAARKVIQANPNDISAIISVNLYGNRPQNHTIYHFCQRHNVFLVEDAAQGWDFGTLGQGVDFSLLSFGHKKNIDLGGGGLLVTRDREIFKKVKLALAKVDVSEPILRKQLAEHYSKLYYEFQAMEKLIPGSQKKFSGFASLFKALYFPKKELINIGLLHQRLTEVEASATQKRYWINKYEQLFGQFNDIQLPDCCEVASRYWRYSVLIIQHKREALVEFLRGNNIDVSCWYPSLAKLGFNAQYLVNDNHMIFGESVMNFWLEDMSEEKFMVLEKALHTYFGESNA